ncbi:MAG: HEAT repeat domain-containing protein [Planctomycetes bacterium]|nr:HEAT repeat domain-containing protein [Planctomycetota bacterium]
MNRLLITGLACAAFAFAAPDSAYAHGGQYRGPGDVVPPNPGGGGGRSPGPGGPSTPGPGGPSTPGPGGPSTPGPAGPGTGGPAGPGPAGGPTTGGGVQLQDDLTRWEFWWEFNKDPFIRLRESVIATGTTTNSDEFFMGAGRREVSKDTLKPTDSEILGTILPALNRALESTTQRDIVSSCMVAMAKIGKDTEQIKILPIFRARLKEKDQEVKETAALAMGISQMPEAVPDLLELAKDSAAGRSLIGDTTVDDRTRGFAAFGLGLIAFATSDHDVKEQILDGLIAVLKDEGARNRNVRVSVINAIGLLRPDPNVPKGKELLNKAILALNEYWNADLGSGEELIQSHVPPAVAKLLEEVDYAEHADLAELAKQLREDYLSEVTGKTRKKRSGNEIVQSCVVALGRMTEENRGKKETPESAAISDALVEYMERGKDQQATYFAMIALAQIGGDANRDALIKMLEKGQKALEKPWAAVALGVLAFNRYDELGARATVDDLIGERLQRWLGEVKNPSALAGLAVALGLTRYDTAADQLRELLEKNKNQDDLAGYICIGLALMGDQRSQEQIRALVETSVRRPTRLQQAAIALGKLGDKSAAETLQRMMSEGDQNLAKMSAIASALGFIGDRRSITPLTKMLFDESLTDISRAFAAVALGGIADKELLPWNSKIGVNINYRAAVETLTNQINGILDIL